MKYGVQVYYRFLLLFQTLPLAAVVSTAYGDMFACHGGLSPSIQTLEELEQIDRCVYVYKCARVYVYKCAIYYNTWLLM
jgi:diadenosine tetraphosphatase ApaH/serine/threonine PP2A family protein phosphatase